MHVGLATGFAYQRGDAYSDAEFIREELENLVWPRSWASIRCGSPSTTSPTIRCRTIRCSC